MTQQDERTDINEAQIAAHWKEEDFISPSPSFVAQANMADLKIFERFGEDKYPECFREY